MARKRVQQPFRQSRGHLSAGALVDGARGVASLPASFPLSGHLGTCAVCRARLHAWNGFAALAGRERRLSVPEAALDRVRMLARPGSGVSPRTVIEAVLGYNGMRIPLPAGTRGRSAPEQFVYEAEGVAVDLRISSEEATHMVIIGQVAHAGQPERRVSDLPVLFLDGDDVKIRALSNAWGEFHLTHPPCARPRLEVGLPGGRILRIALSGARPPRSGKGR
jgi:hypothetical protein